jgi:DNA topoisomerase VI subunit B
VEAGANEEVAELPYQGNYVNRVTGLTWGHHEEELRLEAQEAMRELREYLSRNLRGAKRRLFEAYLHSIIHQLRSYSLSGAARGIRRLRGVTQRQIQNETIKWTCEKAYEKVLLSIDV